MKIYVAGPMTGFPEHNFPAFRAAASTLRTQGHEVISPAELDGDIDHAHPLPWHIYLRRDIRLLVDCDAIYLLDGWRASKGARLEHHIADELGLHILTQTYEGD